MNTATFRTARITKDKNFDGKFYFGVKTTGIFCRPSCPAPIAKEENVTYFTTIFEALERGYRPCYRCRPDVTVEYGHCNGEAAFVVSTALQMIYTGYLNYHSLADLSNELLISDRHLRKLFVDNLGVPPVKIATYHKALFAKRLLLDSGQSITEIAFAAGFSSLRQFNDVFKRIFGKTPTMIRKKFLTEASDQNSTTLLLRYQKPFDFEQMLLFMRFRAIKGVETVTDDSYSRTFRTANTSGFFTVTNNPEQSALELRIGCDDIKCYMEIYHRVRRMFDLDTDFSIINKKFAADKRLAKGMKNGHVPRLPLAFNAFEFVIRAILGQQITVKAATTLAGRIAERAAITCDNSFPAGLDYFFPTPEVLTELNIDNLGITKTRQKTIRTVTQAILHQTVKMTPNQSFEQFANDFLALKGIGQWTVNYVAMRGLGMVDSFPASDLGVIKALTTGDGPPSQKEILKRAEDWRPYRAYAALCLWNS